MDNKNFQLISSILRGKWLMQREWAEDHMYLVQNLLENKTVTESFKSKGKILAFEGDDFEVEDDLSGPLTRIDNVAILDLTGPMMKYGGWCSYGTMDYIRAMEEAYSDDRIEAILIKVDSPGGDVRSIATLYDLVKMNYKPVVGFVEDLAASAAYYSICGAKHIMVSQATNEVGSIGVYTTIRDYSERMKAMGISEKVIYSRLSSEKNGDYREALAGDTAKMEDALDVIAEDFISAVNKSRGDKINLKAGDPFKGKTFFAKDALSIGLIDEIGTFAQAFDKAQSLAGERKKGVQSNLILNTNSNMFDKYPQLTALRGVAAADVTEESLNALNAQLSDKGILGIVAVPAGFVAEAEQLETQLNAKIKELNTAAAGQLSVVADLQKSVSDKDTLITQLQGQVTTLTTERDGLQTKVVELGKLPATDPAKPVKREGTEVKSENPFLTEADIELQALKAGMLPSIN